MKCKVIILIILIIVISFTMKKLDRVDETNKAIAYRGQMSNKTRAYSLMGMKKVGSGLFLLKQTASIGETVQGNRALDIKKSSLEISELNPYYLENYYAGANVLAFIRTYLDYKGALDILNRGLLYNPDDEFLKKYSAGMLAGSKGDDEAVLENYEKIAEQYPDPLMIKSIYDIYKIRLKQDKNFEDKYLYYAEILFNDKNSRYKNFVEQDLKELGYLKK